MTKFMFTWRTSKEDSRSHTPALRFRREFSNKLNNAGGHARQSSSCKFNGNTAFTIDKYRLHGRVGYIETRQESHESIISACSYLPERFLFAYTYTGWTGIRSTTEQRVILREEIRKKFGTKFFFIWGLVFEKIDFKVCSSLSFYAMNCLRC